jgi:hypothetical protein
MEPFPQQTLEQMMKWYVTMCVKLMPPESLWMGSHVMIPCFKASNPSPLIMGRTPF